MKTLKFRIWNGKEFLKGRDLDNICIDPDGDVLVCEGGELCLAGEEYQLQQFTGLLDKTGREIYEGDIYNLDHYLNNPYYSVFYQGEYWNKKATQTEENFLKNHVDVYCDSQHRLATHAKFAQVIGNTLENPELLNL